MELQIHTVNRFGGRDPSVQAAGLPYNNLLFSSPYLPCIFRLSFKSCMEFQKSLLFAFEVVLKFAVKLELSTLS